MDFSDMVYLGRSGTDEVFKSPVRIRKITTSDGYTRDFPLRIGESNVGGRNSIL